MRIRTNVVRVLLLAMCSMLLAASVFAVVGDEEDACRQGCEREKSDCIFWQTGPDGVYERNCEQDYNACRASCWQQYATCIYWTPQGCVNW